MVFFQIYRQCFNVLLYCYVRGFVLSSSEEVFCRVFWSPNLSLWLDTQKNPSAKEKRCTHMSTIVRSTRYTIRIVWRKERKPLFKGAIWVNQTLELFSFLFLRCWHQESCLSSPISPTRCIRGNKKVAAADIFMPASISHLSEWWRTWDSERKPEKKRKIDAFFTCRHRFP